MEQSLLPFDYRTEEDLLKKVLSCTEKAVNIAQNFDLKNLSDAHRQELGLTESQYQRLQAAIELGKRVAEATNEYKTKNRITSSTDAIEFCRARFSRLIHEACQEEFHVITLTTKNVVISTHQITVGTLDASLVHPREVFRKAIKDASSSIILAHNHPSGDPTPSQQDIEVTNRLTQSGELIGIDVLDHVVMGKGGCISIQEYR